MKLPALLLCTLVLGLASPASAGKTVSARGRVVDADGKLVEGVKVYAVMWRYENLDTLPVIRSYVKAAAVSGEDGSWEFKSLPKHTGRGAYVFIAFTPEKHIGWVQGMGDLVGDEWQWGGFPPEGDCYTLVVSGFSVWEGRVVDESGQGVAGALVEPAHIHRKNDELGILNRELSVVVKIDPVTTDSEGRFKFKGVPEGVTIGPVITAEGYAEFESYGSEDPKFVMKPGGEIKGKLLDSRGKGIAGAVVSALDYQEGHSGKAQTDKEGCYSIKGLVPGTYRVSTNINDELVKSVDKVALVPGKVVTVPDLITTDGVFIKGQVVDSKTGKPVHGAVIQAFDARNRVPDWDTLGKPSDKQGFYRVKVLPGEVYLWNYNCMDPFYASIREEPRKLKVPESGMNGVDFKARRSDVLKGRVVDQSGNPVAGAKVSSITPGGEGPKTVADAKGYFKMPIFPEACLEGG